MSETPAGPVPEGVSAAPSDARYAAIDLGSNSFHLLVARVQDGGMQPLDRLREPVRLASGLRPDGSLSTEAQRRALEALERFGERIRHLDREVVRAVGTNALRHARRIRPFLREAERVLGVPIEIVSGQEEARLIHLGVMRTARPPGERCLVIDIGGGSTEIIRGPASGVESAHSLEMGCVTFTTRFFPDGKFGEKALRRATKAARLLLEPVRGIYRTGWDHALGASGTFLAATSFARTRTPLGGDVLTGEAIDAMAETIRRGGDPDRLVELGVGAARAPVFAAGVAILVAIWKELDLDRVTPAEGALREGVLFDLMGRLHEHDAREATVARLEARYGIDTAHAERVRATALQLLEQTFGSWSLRGGALRRVLSWAARLHEIGLSIAHDGHQRHGGYVLRHAHLPGFSRDEQALLAALVAGHRGGMAPEQFESLPQEVRQSATRLLVLLRLAVCLHRNRSPLPLPPLEASANGVTIGLGLPAGWLADHPLTRHVLLRERRRLAPLGIRLELR